MRALALFWAVLAVSLSAGAAWLNALGPPPSPGPAQAETSLIPPPDPALLEVASSGDGSMLPRIGPDGRQPRQVYARRAGPADGRPRIGLLLAGVGLNEADSLQAIRDLPGEVTLAFSPYATHSAVLQEAARAAGHETLISLPLEPGGPAGYYVNDPGGHTLLTGAPPAQNRERLDWALGRIQGYVGATGALGDMRGERFAGAADQMDGVLDQLAGRGLLYVDARIGAPPLPRVWSRGIDVVIDEQPGAEELDARLADLLREARAHGSAVGLAGVVRPGTTARIAAWARSLDAAQAGLAPVSALAAAPPP
jgi:polysaccharide deacetylase 2 family uncharacterized protein YibQ